MDIVELLASNVRQLRQIKGITQEELAGLANLSGRHVGDVERARHAVTIRVLSQLATALDVEPHELIRPPGK